MGLIQSLICAVVLCFERVVSWMCCALLLVVILVMIVILTLYGITLGYHYAQKEIARMAVGEQGSEGGGGELLREGETQQTEVNEPLVRLVAVNRTQPEIPGNIPGVFEGRTVAALPLYLESTPTPLVVLESESPIKEVELTPHEKELALKLIGRFRRIKRNNYTSYAPPTSRHGDSVTTPAA